MSNDLDNNPSRPLTILAWAVLVAVIGTVLYYVLPVVLKAIGTAGGLFIAVSTTGLATAGVVGSWVAPVATIGVATLAVTGAGVAVKHVSDSVRDKPYEWGLPLLGVFAGFASTLAKDTGLDSNVYKWLFGGITALLIVVAGACYKRPSWIYKIVAVLLYVLPPLVLLGWSTSSTGNSSLTSAFGSVSRWTWLGIICIVIAGGLIGILAHLDARKQ